MSFKLNDISGIKELMYWISFERDGTSKVFDMSEPISFIKVNKHMNEKVNLRENYGIN